MKSNPYIEVLCNGEDCSEFIEVPFHKDERITNEIINGKGWSIKKLNQLNFYGDEDEHYCPKCQERNL